MALFGLKAPCKVCGEAAMKWYEPLGFVHAECVPVEWFESFDRRRLLGLPPPPPPAEAAEQQEPPPF